MPRSLARATRTRTSSGEKSLPHSPPNCQVPRPMTDTFSSVFPSLLYFIVGPSCLLHQLNDGIDEVGLSRSRHAVVRLEVQLVEPPPVHRGGELKRERLPTLHHGTL